VDLTGRGHTPILENAQYAPGVAQTDVYGTARGRARARIASPLAARARTRRHATFFGMTGLEPGMSVLDVGCGALGLRALEPELEITGVDLAHRPDYPGPFLQADVTAGLPYEDGAFDLVYSSSVVEHVPRARREAFAREVARVGRGLYVQTPAFSFPVEPHALLPFAHWLPAAVRKPVWRLGAQGEWEDIDLLRRREMTALFGAAGARVHAERVGPLTKSWIAIAPVAPRT
jgi:SAM-dependent methyltransferase